MRGLVIACAVALALFVEGCASTPAASPAASVSRAVETARAATEPATSTATPSAGSSPSFSSSDRESIERASLLVNAVGGSAGPATAVDRMPGTTSCATQVSFRRWSVCWNDVGELTRLVDHEQNASPTGAIDARIPDDTFWSRGDTWLRNLGVEAGRVTSAAQFLDRMQGDWQSYVDGYPTAAGNLRIECSFDGAFISYRRLAVETAPRPARTITAAQAEAIAVPDAKRRARTTFVTELEWWGRDVGTPLVLGWVVDLNDGGGFGGRVVVDAATGAVIETSSIS
jgi:hypothetical protein